MAQPSKVFVLLSELCWAVALDAALLNADAAFTSFRGLKARYLSVQLACWFEVFQNLRTKTLS